MTSLPMRAPEVTTDTEPFWRATADHRLLLQRCAACTTLIWYPRFFCPHCGALDTTWEEAAGTGTVYSFTITRRGFGPFQDADAAVDFSWPQPVVALAAQARAFGEEVAATRQLKEEAWVVGFDREASLELGRRGWLGMTWPVEVGGHGRSALERFAVAEALIATGAPLAATWVGDRQIGPSLIAYGTDEQRRRFLPPMVQGTVTWCIGMSEPDAGSDLAGVRTRAVADGDEFVVEGRKIWTSFAAVADHCYLIARTGEASTGHVGLSELIVDMDSPGIAISPIVDVTGEAHFCGVDSTACACRARTSSGSWGTAGGS